MRAYNRLRELRTVEHAYKVPYIKYLPTYLPTECALIILECMCCRHFGLPSITANRIVYIITITTLMIVIVRSTRIKLRCSYSHNCAEDNEKFSLCCVTLCNNRRTLLQICLLNAGVTYLYDSPCERSPEKDCC